MSLATPVLMFAADHRWQLEEWCDANDVDRARIPEAKAAIAEAFSLARRRSADVRAHGALLLDEQYAGPQIAAARAAGISVGTPAEWPGSFPLRWASEPMDRALTGTFVKVLVRHRPDVDPAIVESQLVSLRTLGTWCRENARPLVLEVVVPRAGEPEEHFESIGRAPIVAAYVRRAYDEGIVPAFWKMEGTTSADAAALVDEAIGEHPEPRFLVLGKGAGLDLVAHWFAVAKGMRTGAGFAVGRTIYMEPVSKWLTGISSREVAVDAMAATYLRLVEAWVG
jgi:5-dehydro-2-deoxygluconokinase